ncbi:MAG: YihY/virulence factor BrkB family protein [Cellulosilyticaceae bacterium]
MIKEFIAFGIKLKKRFTGHNITARSAQMTYYWILAFFPFLIVIMSILSYTSIAEAEFLEYISNYVPDAIIPFIENTLTQLIQYRSTTLLSFGVVVTIWSASAAVNVMIKGIHTAYSAVDGRPFWIRKIISMFYTLIFAVLIAVMIIILVFGSNIGEYVINLFIPNDAWYYGPIWELFRLTAPLAAILVGLYMMYKFIPRRHLRYKNVWAGTIFASLGWYIFSFMFSLYVNHFSKYNQMYGSIGGMFILIIWLYTTGILLLLGAEINALLQDTIRMRRK